MELSIILFFMILLVPGLWLVLSIGREFKQRQELNDQRRIEHERAAYISTRRRAPSRSVAPPEYPTVETFAQEATASVIAPVADNETAHQGSSGARGGSRHDRTTPHTGTAFEQFLSATPHAPSDQFLTSQVDEAFEQFLSEMQRREMPRATGQESSGRARS